MTIYDNIPSLIDHTLLRPEAVESEIRQLCSEAREWSFRTVCIHPCWIKLASGELAGSSVQVCTVIGFPLGANETETKLFEAEGALSRGASELDVVQNVGWLRSGERSKVQREIAELAELAHGRNALLKVILETCLLTDEEKRAACQIAIEARADFVKTSTGFLTAGATRQDVALMRSAVGNRLGVKASGGVRTAAALRQMVEAGANRIGTSSGIRILQEIEVEGGPASLAAPIGTTGRTSY